MADQILLTPQRALDENANAEPGAKAYFYEAGTSTPMTVYSDSGLTTAHPSPLVADSEGNFAQVFFSGATGAKVDMYDASDVQMTGYPIDNVPTVSTGTSGADSVSFTPTADNAATDVQAAIENALTEVVQDTTPQLGGHLDVNGKAIGDGTRELMTFTEDASAVNHVNIENEATGAGPIVSAAGDDTDIDLLVKPKGTGRVKLTQPNLIVGSDADGDIYYRSGGNLARLAKGTAGQALVMNSGATAPEWSSSGGLTKLATIDLANDATADFTAFDSTKYDAYLFVLQNVIPATDVVDFYIRTSTDGGSTYDTGGTDYAYAINNTSTGTGTNLISAGASNITAVSPVGSAAGEDGISGTVLVSGPHLAKKTVLSIDLGSQDQALGYDANNGKAWRLSSADVDAIRFLFSAGNLESGTITMYGMAN